MGLSTGFFASLKEAELLLDVLGREQKPGLGQIKALSVLSRTRTP